MKSIVILEEDPKNPDKLFELMQGLYKNYKYNTVLLSISKWSGPVPAALQDMAMKIIDQKITRGIYDPKELSLITDAAKRMDINFSNYVSIMPLKIIIRDGKEGDFIKIVHLLRDRNIYTETLSKLQQALIDYESCQGPNAFTLMERQEFDLPIEPEKFLEAAKKCLEIGNVAEAISLYTGLMVAGKDIGNKYEIIRVFNMQGSFKALKEAKRLKIIN